MFIRRILAVALLSSGLVAPAQAFDLPPAVIDAPEIDTFSSSTSGWYIRGDLGYNGRVNTGKPDYRLYDTSTDSYTPVSFDMARISSNYSMAAGIGYQFNDLFRTDMTVDYFQGSMQGKSELDIRCTTADPVATTCGLTHAGDFGALSLLANGYVDLGTYAGFTPYLGAGAGVANIDWGTVSTSFACRNGAATCTNRSNYGSVDNPGLESWRFTYALMAGVSYDLSAHTKLDLGYRYSHIAGGGMFDFNDLEQGNGATGDKGRDKGFTRHEFRAGLRLTTW